MFKFFYAFKIRMLFYITLTFLISSCGTLYGIKVDDKDAMNYYTKQDEGSLIQTHVFRCNRQEFKIHFDSKNNVYFSCLSDYQGEKIWNLYNSGPRKEPQENRAFFEYRDGKREFESAISQHITFPFTRCDENSNYDCVNKHKRPYSKIVLVDRKPDYYIEYIDLNKKLDMYKRVINGEPIKIILDSGRNKEIESLLFDDIFASIIANKNSQHNKELFKLISDKKDSDFEQYFSMLLDERKEFAALSDKERSTWYSVDIGCKIQVPSDATSQSTSSVKTVDWSGNCVDGRAEGSGILAVTMQNANYIALKGVMERGRFEGRTDVEFKSSPGSYYSTTDKYYLHKDGRMKEAEYLSAKTQNTLDFAFMKVKYDILKCASSLDTNCLEKSLEIGMDIDKKSDDGITPLFKAILEIRKAKEESQAGVATVKWLLEHGADTTYRANPFSAAYKKDMTPEELLVVSVVDNIFDLKAPDAPLTQALFNDPDVKAKNSIERNFINRAYELGLTRKEFMAKLNKVEEMRRRNTFQDFSEAFSLTRTKQDFIAAQKMAKTDQQKKKLEYLAVLATGDKTKIFNIKTTLDGVSAEKLNNNSSDTALLVFKFNYKNTDADFKGNTEVNVNKKSPVDIKGSYKVTVRYTLSASLVTTHKVEFILSQTTQRTKTINRTAEKTFVIKPNNFTDSASLDFGKLTIAQSSESLGGISKMDTILSEDPKMTAEIIKVEMIND